jgi:hypothetical protein
MAACYALVTPRAMALVASGINRPQDSPLRLPLPPPAAALIVKGARSLNNWLMPEATTHLVSSLVHAMIIFIKTSVYIDLARRLYFGEVRA